MLEYIYYLFISKFTFEKNKRISGWCDCYDGIKHFKNGKLHRENGPAIYYTDGDKYWYNEGQLHREDGPAIERVDGSKRWYKDGEPHRLDGPAIEYVNGKRVWFKQGKLHRLDGPAIEYPDGVVEWWIEGKKYTEEECKKLSFARLNNLEVFL